ncbi:TPA: NADH-quinone oxidoreductase subunit D [Candidatus Sumerlaeota bacterium]|jgi:ech hydrogenase subunit E|nr:NADH-quinone oxidoreductase subunit D [Candidatus Sumerlaeota bacterium]
MTRQTIIPFGPQHPVLPEPIQLKLVLEDKKVVGAIPSIGYIHRGLEKLAQQKDYIQSIFLIERICGICSFLHSMAYCQGIEEMMNVEVPPRANNLRIIWAEMHRIHSHLLWMGLLADSFGFESLFMEIWRCRETVLDIMEETAGGRVMLGVCTVGGVRRDIPPELIKKVLATCDELQAHFDHFIPSILNDYSVKQRTVGVGVLTKEVALERGVVGPVARASGVVMDHRVAKYGAYANFDVEPQIEQDGDCYARSKVRVRELYQSLDLVRQSVATLPEGEFNIPVKGNPDGEVISRVEQPRGEVLYYLRGNGSKFLDRMRVRTPTFANLPGLLAMIPGCELSDVPVIILSIDPCISCTER